MAEHPAILVSRETFQNLVFGMYFLALATVISTSLISAPYGRHVRPGWGPQIPSRLGWIVMESPAVWWTLLVFSYGQYSSRTSSRVLLCVFLFHYIHRVLVFPFRAKLRGKRMPVAVAALAFSYNLYNDYLQAYQISEFHLYTPAWFYSLPFLSGLFIFALGFCVNVWADSVLFCLRKDDTDRTYKIPTGLLYDVISCPNYFGEILEWMGWGLMTWSFAGLSFFVYTCANLIPRACAHHAWYRQKFEEYPKQRRAVVPFLL